MAIIDAPTYAANRNQSFTGGALAAVTAACAAVSEAIKRHTGQAIERATYTSYLDAPWNADGVQVRQWPLVSVTTLHYNPTGYGVSANYTAAHLLEPNVDYLVDVDDDVNGWSRRGWIRRIGQDFWGARYTRGLSMPLTNRYRNIRKAVRVVHVSGYEVVPDDLARAATDAVSMMYARKMRGVPETSEGWNGYNVSWASEYLANAIVNSPDIASTLRHYGNVMSFA